MKVVAFLPVKGTSERIECKNTRLLSGKPLFLHTLEKLIECDFIDQVYLDSESDEIFEMASYLDCNFLKREKVLATNKTNGHELFWNEIKNIDADIYIQIMCTSPFIEKETIKHGIDILKEHDNFDSVVLVKKDKQYLWANGQPNYDKKNIPNSFELPDTIAETTGLYIIKKEAAKKLKMRIGEHPYLLAASPIESIDINYENDFKLASLVMAGQKEEEVKLLNHLKVHLSSSILSDILNEYNLNGVIQGLAPNIKDIKVFGRAKTLKLRKIRDNDNPEAIYKALESYKTICLNDIIMVENEEKEHAYFGEINANYAIQSGASAAIIGGKTRDSSEVKSMNFPVFATGTTCKDIKNKAVVESINKTITINNIEVKPDNLIFADNDGVIVIPKDIEKEILNEAIKLVNREKKEILNLYNC